MKTAYLKDDIDGVRILFTGTNDKEKVYDEVRRLLEFHHGKQVRKVHSETAENNKVQRIDRIKFFYLFF